MGREAGGHETNEQQRRHPCRPLHMALIPLAQKWGRISCIQRELSLEEDTAAKGRDEGPGDRPEPRRRPPPPKRQAPPSRRPSVERHCPRTATCPRSRRSATVGAGKCRKRGPRPQRGGARIRSMHGTVLGSDGVVRSVWRRATRRGGGGWRRRSGRSLSEASGGPGKMRRGGAVAESRRVREDSERGWTANGRGTWI